MTTLSLSLSGPPMYDPSGGRQHHGAPQYSFESSIQHHSRQEPELYTPSSTNAPSAGGYFTDNTPLESPMEEIEPDWEAEPEMYPLPLITPPEMNFSAFQFPSRQSQQHSARGRSGSERARSRSVNHPQGPPSVTPMLSRRRSHHHLSTPPPPLSSRLQHKSSGYAHHPQQSYHQHRYSALQQVPHAPAPLHISPPFLYDHQQANQMENGRERRISNASSSAGSFYSTQSPISVPSSITSSFAQTFQPQAQIGFSPSSLPLSAASSAASSTSPLTPFSAAMVLHHNIPHTIPSSSSPLTLTPQPAEAEDDGERPWDLVPYHVPWGSSYVGYRAGTLPGPEGKSLFLRSPTPVKNQRTSQACEKCRERKAKCSGARPSCARCVQRGLVCEYGPELKKKDSQGFDDIADDASRSDSPADSVNADNKSELDDVKPSSLTDGSSSGRPIRKLPERNARTRASVPNLRVKASAGNAARKSATSVKGASVSPIHRPSKVRAPVPLNLSVRIPTIHNLSLSPQPHSSHSSASPPATSETSSNADFQVSLSGSSGGEQEMTTPAPTTALFFQQDGNQSTAAPADENRTFFRGGGYSNDQPPASAVSASAGSLLPSPLDSFGGPLEYPPSSDMYPSHHHSPMDKHHSVLIQDHTVRYSASMPQLHMSYAMNDLDIPMPVDMRMDVSGFDDQERALAHQAHDVTASIGGGAGVSPQSVDSSSSVDVTSDYAFAVNNGDYDPTSHFQTDSQLSSVYHERDSSLPHSPISASEHHESVASFDMEDDSSFPRHHHNQRAVSPCSAP